MTDIEFMNAVRAAKRCLSRSQLSDPTAGVREAHMWLSKAVLELDLRGALADRGPREI